jgi:hypothetical protein
MRKPALKQSSAGMIGRFALAKMLLRELAREGKTQEGWLVRMLCRLLVKGRFAFRITWVIFSGRRSPVSVITWVSQK